MAGEGKILYTDLFDAKWKQEAMAAFSEVEKSATADIKKIAEAAKGIKLGLPDQVKSSADMAKLNQAIKDYNDLQAKNIDLQNKLNAVQAKKRELTEEEMRATEASKASQKALRERITTEEKLSKVHKDSIAALKIHTAQMVKERETIDPLSARFKTLTKDIDANEKTLKKHDETIGRHQRNVGNYSDALKGIGGKVLGFASGLGIAVGAMEVFKGIMSSTDAVSDKFAEFMSGTKQGLEFLARSIVNLDFTNLIEGFKQAYQEGARYEQTLDDIAQRQRSLGLVKSNIEGQILDQRKIARAAWSTVEEKKAAIEEIIRLTQLEMDETKKVTQQGIDNELRNAAVKTGIQIKDAENLTEEEKKNLAEREALITKYFNTYTTNYDEWQAKLKAGAELQKYLDSLVERVETKNGGVITSYAKRDEAIKNLSQDQKDLLALQQIETTIIDKQRDSITASLQADIDAGNEKKAGEASLMKLRNALYKEYLAMEKDKTKAAEDADKVAQAIWEGQFKAQEELANFIIKKNAELDDLPEVDINVKDPGDSQKEWKDALENMQDFASNAYDNTREGQKKLLDKQLADLEEFHRLGLINEADYQAALKELQEKGMQPKAWQDKLGEITGYFSGFANEAINIWQSLADKQMSIAQQQVDIEQKKVDDLQSKLDKETELQRQGVANNSDLLRKQLEEQKSVRDQANKELAKAQKQQQRINDAQQISAIITAVANIISGWSTIPLIGSILGIVAAGAMLVSWLALRSKSKATVPAYAKGTEYVDDVNAPQGVDTIDAKLDRGERIVDKEENKKLKGIKNKDLARYSRLGQAIMEGNIDLYALNFTTSKPTESRIDFTELSHWQKEGVTQQKKTNELLGKWKHYSADGHKVVDMNGNVIHYT